MGATLLFEQPELHLHAGAAKGLAKVFIDTIENRNAHIIAETHSRELFLQLFEELRNGKFSPLSIAAYEIRREGGESVFKRIEVIQDGSHFEADHPRARSLE